MTEFIKYSLLNNFLPHTTHTYMYILYILFLPCTIFRDTRSKDTLYSLLKGTIPRESRHWRENRFIHILDAYIRDAAHFAAHAFANSVISSLFYFEIERKRIQRYIYERTERKVSRWGGESSRANSVSLQRRATAKSLSTTPRKRKPQNRMAKRVEPIFVSGISMLIITIRMTRANTRPPAWHNFA